MQNSKSPDFSNFEQPLKFLVVGIGASAGGIRSLKTFFEHVPPDSGLAYVVILHLSPDYDSQLAELLQAVASIPVAKVVQKIKVQPNNVYVVPPNQHLIIEDGFIAASPNIHTEERRAPVDIFFRNLADTYGPRAICVVLSGTGANGSMGLKRVKEFGGVAYVQSPREAEFSEMPRNSIATDLVDEVLPVAEIPDRIINYRDSLGKVHISIDSENGHEQQQLALREIFAQLRLQTGHDFSNYKRPTLLRRVERRINIRSLPDLSSYAVYVQDNTEEAAALLKDLLISVTNFFRDPIPFRAIEDQVLPMLLRGKKSDANIRIWVAGCATGEEAYSLAMLFAEQTLDLIDAPRVQIFATDIDEAAIATAREGYYTINDAADVSPERLRRFFHVDAQGYRVRKEIREMILFAHHNFLKDPPFSRLDLVTCRNVLIYLNAVAQERVMETFHFALEPHGFLFLGTAESVDGANDLYKSFSRENHIYQAKEGVPRHFPVTDRTPSVYPAATSVQIPAVIEQKEYKPVSFGELHQKLLEQYAPPSVIVDENYTIVHLSEKAGNYLQVHGGEFSQNLLDLVPSTLRLELRSALYQATHRHHAVVIEDARFNVNGQSESVHVRIRPVVNDIHPNKGLILILFDQNINPGDPEVRVFSSDEPVARQLEDELLGIKAELQNSVRQHGMQEEELRASNEELQAMNEELRSSAEELETSKEELQSINEELRTVNQELKVKIEETSVAGNNLLNLINSAAVGTIFLDRSFRIKMFTPSVLEIFNLRSADYGRPMTDITHKLENVQLERDVETVLNKLISVEREVVTTDKRYYMMRLLPYRTAEDSINGVVITFYEISKRRQAEQALQHSEERLRLLIESARDYAIITLDPNRNVVSWSVGAALMIGFNEKEIIGKSGDIIFTDEEIKAGAPGSEAQKAADNGRVENERWHVRKDGSRFWGSGSVSPLRERDGKLIGFVKIMRDLTEARRLEAAKFLLASVVETSNDSIITIDFERTITSWNKAAESLYGYSSAEAVGKRLEMLTLPEDFVAILANIDKLQNDKEVKVFDTAKVHKEGYIVELEIVMSPVLNTSGELIGVSTISRDVSQRKRREAQLSFLAELSKSLIKNSKVTANQFDVTSQVGTFFQASVCAFAEINENYHKPLIFQQWYANGSEPTNENNPTIFQHSLEGFSGALSSGEEIVVENILGDTRIKSKDFYRNNNINSFVIIPLMHADEWRCSLAVYLEYPYSWSYQELNLLREVLTRAWHSIERGRAEDELQMSENRFRTLTDAVPQVIWANDGNGIANYFNQRWFEYSGLSLEESYGKGWEAIVHPEDAPGSKAKWQQAKLEGQIFDSEYRLKNKDGQYRWHIGRNVPLKDERGHVIGWFGSATDIEVLKTTEVLMRQTADRLQLALDAGQFGSYEYDLATGQITGTAQHTEIFGYQENKAFSFEELKSLVIEEDREMIESELLKAIEERKIYTLEYRIRRLNNQVRWIKSAGRLISGESGEPLKVVGITLDITEQKLFTEELRRRVEEQTLELQRSNEDLRQFAHVASHDLKEPVRKIKTFNNRVQDEFDQILPEKAKTYLGKIDIATTRMYTMIDGVLAYSKLGNAPQLLQRVNLMTIIENIETDLEVMIMAKDAQITSDNLPTIIASEVLMYQLFYNLILNSLKFSRRDTITRISISSRLEVINDRSTWHITVKDNGIGFDPGYAKIIFNPFTRLHSGEEYEGTGLGLALCKKIVERHQGSISVSSQEGEGACFDILFPVTE